MGSSSAITLFAEPSVSGRRPTAYVVSILIHGALLALIFFGILYNPRIVNMNVGQRLNVRRLDLHTPEQQPRNSGGNEIEYPGPTTTALAHSSPAGEAAQHIAMRPVPQVKSGPQTLVQPDLVTHLTLPEEIPLPSMMIWSRPTKVVKGIIAPLPAKPPVADVRPSINMPNEEMHLADIKVSAADRSMRNLPLVASNTSPVVAHKPEPKQSALSTISQTTAQPTPAAVLSVSDLRMLSGTVVLPPVNETASYTAPVVLAPGQGHGSGATGSAKAGGPVHSTGAEQGAGNAAGKSSASTSGASQQPEVDTGANSQLSTSRLTMPKDGHFGAVVVGTSLGDEYPELAGFWNGRISYTVYLHVGLSKSWILQYSLPRDADVSTVGNIAHLEAPWPYNIVRPNLAPGSIDADALVIHGFVDQDGHFKRLSVAFPQAFPQARFVLNSLQQWQFRPATRNGQDANVEVLLIIPDTEE
jgi:hypothetical protein